MPSSSPAMPGILWVLAPAGPAGPGAYPAGGTCCRCRRRAGASPPPRTTAVPCPGAVQALVTGHGHKGRPPPGQVHRQHPRRLGGVHDQGRIRLPAASGDVLHRQHRPEYVGNVGADHGPGAASAGWPGKIPPPPGPAGRAACRSPSRKARDGVQGPGDGVVLISGDHHPVPGTQQRPDSQVQAMGGASGDDGVFRLGNPRSSAASWRHINRLPRPGGRPDSSPGPGSSWCVPPGHGPTHGGGFFQGSGPGVEIDHCAASR